MKNIYERIVKTYDSYKLQKSCAFYYYKVA